ncbi:rho GTPase-activating protein 44 isoform X7 [Syngnathus scovelli]|uniref:rho GTPase-activating protein 44 isoform X7 n=1 Tax=Syngnathus scovelli TaxID=161590 RepID=UPI0035CBE4DC
MKKQFNRMRQLANQTVGRAEKTEVLSEDLLQVEKRLDLVKQVTHSAHKKLTACLQGHQGADVERKSLKSPSKKLPLSILAQCLAEGAAVLGDDALLGKMLKMCGEAEEKLAQELMDFELQVEQDVVEPLSTLAEVDIPNIQKQRKHLAKLVLDMDSSRTRYQQSSKSSSHPGTLQPGAKSDSLREEMEDAATRMEICKDQLSADMYAFAAKEVDYANYFQTLMETQAEYHSKSLEILTAILPQIRAHQEAWLEKPSFGKPLEEHLNISGREIAFPIEACVTALLECGLREEGLFRVAPSASKLKKLKASLDCGVLDAQEYSSDPHAIAGALKSYLRELPEPLMTMELYDEWIQASNIQDMDKRLQALMGTCAKLPTDNLNNFRYLVKFLAKLSEYQDYNKMTPGNMAIVLGPNLLWTHSEPDMTEVLTTLSLQMVGIIEPIIQHADWFFPGKMDFNLTGSYGSPVHVNYNCNYSSLPSPDTEQSERMRPHHDQSRRPLSVATDNMMLEFYKEKDGPAWACGSWILPGCRARARLRWPARAAAPRQGSAPRPPTRSPPPSRPPRQLPHRLSRRPPLRPPWKGSDGSRERVFASVRRVRDLTRLRAWVQAHGTRRSDVWANRPDTSQARPPPGENRPPPPYHAASHYHFYPKPPPCARPAAPGPESQPPASPPHHRSGFAPPAPLPSSSSSSSSSSLDINSNPKPSCLHFPKHSPPGDGNASPLFLKPALVLARHEQCLGYPPSAPPPWAACPGARERGVPRPTSSSKSKELSPVIGHKGIQAASSTVLPSGSMQNCSPCPRLGERSPRSLGKGSKKLAPEPPKVPYYQPVALSDQSAGQPSPVSQSPTPPGTPSVYGLLCAPGQALPPCSPGQPLSGAPHSLSSLPSLAGTLAKSRPRQRPGLPPPQPPVGLGGRDPGPVRAPALQPPEPALTDGLSPGESMSTGLSRGILMMISSQSLYFLVRGGRQEMACPHPQCMEPVRLAKRDDTEGKANRIHGSTAATSAITVKVERSTTRHRAVLHTRRRRILGGRTTVNTTLNASSSVMGLPRALMTKISELLHGLVRRSVGRWRRSESAQKKRRSRPRREAAEVVSSSSRASGLPTGTSNVCPPPPPLSASSSGCPLPCAKASCSSCRFLIKVRCLHTGQARVSRICPSA